VFTYKIPTLGISEAWHYAPLVVSGALIVLFCIEHIIANVQRKEVVPAWL
jgi:TRAP-type C4-dicarboxylate transport system permease small subunit